MKVLSVLACLALLFSVGSTAYAEDSAVAVTAPISFIDQQDSSPAAYLTSFGYATVQKDGSIAKEYDNPPGYSPRVFYGPRIAGLYFLMKVGMNAKYVNGPQDARIAYQGPGQVGDGSGWWADDGEWETLVDLSQVTSGSLEQFRLLVTYIGARRHKSVRILVLNLAYSSKSIKQTDKVTNYLQMAEYAGPESWAGLILYTRDYNRITAELGGNFLIPDDIYSFIRGLVRYPTGINLKAEYPMAFTDLTTFDDGWSGTDGQPIPVAAQAPASPTYGAPMSAGQVMAALGGASPHPVTTSPQYRVQEVAQGLWFQATGNQAITVTRHQLGIDRSIVIEPGAGSNDGHIFGNYNPKTTFTVIQGDSSLLLNCDGKIVPSGEDK